MRRAGFVVLLFIFWGIGTAYAQAPKISSFSPLTGPVGTQVTISGSNFSAIADSNVVFFGATHAIVNSANTSQLSLTVPMGATYRPITVINKETRLSAQSALAFNATFSPAVTEFDPRIRLEAGTGASDVQVADIDGDGKPDIVATNPTAHTLMIFYNKSNKGKLFVRSFASPVVYQTGAQPGVAAITDLDGDGKPDIVLMNIGFANTPNANNSLTIFHNLSTPAHIKLAPVLITDSTATTPASNNFQLKPGDKVARIGDFDGDGKPDIAVLNTAGFVSICSNKYTAGLPLNTLIGAAITVPIARYPTTFAAGDLDNDGKLDMIVANHDSSAMTVLYNTYTTGAITPSAFHRIDFALNYQPLVVSLADIDGDGKLDVAIGKEVDEPITLFHNTSTPGHFNGTTINISNVNTISNYNNDIVLQDINGDGKPDVLSLNDSLRSVNLYTNKSTPGLTTASYFNNKINCPVITIPDCVADLDGDGRPELIVASMFGIDIYHSTAPPLQVQSVIEESTADMLIYPNPASATTYMKYTLPGRSDALISIRSVDGKLIKSYNTGEQPAGSHTITIETGSLKTGIYVISITATNFNKAGKLIKL